IQGTVHPEDARATDVQREHDAKGCDARARSGPRGAGDVAHRGRGQRVLVDRTRAGPWGTGFRHPVQSAGSHVRDRLNTTRWWELGVDQKYTFGSLELKHESQRHEEGRF